VHHDGDPPAGLDSEAVPMEGSGDRANEWLDLTAIYIGGPKDGQTEEIGAGPDPGDAPGVVRVVGFEFWPMAHPFRPTGRYEPERIDDGFARFVWQPYSPEEQLARQLKAEDAGTIIQADALSRVISKLFRGTPIIDWNVRRVLRKQETEARQRGHED
jgi:hypothetical protein